MNETQKRIKAYQDALPGLRERVAAVGLLLVVSLAMMTSASFAWITLSRAPEVTSVTTNVASNGNLEIALAGLIDPETKQAMEPNESGVTDSFSAAGQDVLAANMTWGNLVNLSNASYGISSITLRPALLSPYNVNKNPLYGATYAKDGRVVGIADKYRYATLTMAEDGTEMFTITTDSNPHYGVRAIASVKYDSTLSNIKYTTLENKAVTANVTSSELYVAMLTDESKKYIPTLEGLMTVYVQDQIEERANSTKRGNCAPYMERLHAMLLDFQEVLKEEGVALTALANMQVYIKSGFSSDMYEYYATIQDVLSDSANWADLGVNMASLATHKSDIENLAYCEEQVGAYAEQVRVNPNVNIPWDEQLSEVVDRIVNISTAEVDGMTIDKLARQGVSTLLDFIDQPSHQAVIKGGILKNYEQRIGTCMGNPQHMGGKKITVTLTVDATSVAEEKGISGTLVGILGYDNKKVSVTMTTDAAPTFLFVADSLTTADMNEKQESGGDAVAKDIYGLAVDVWTRTNAAGAVLKLEGTILYNTVHATGFDQSGNEVPLYTITWESEVYDVYQVGDVWYYQSSHTPVEEVVLYQLKDAGTYNDGNGNTLPLYSFTVVENQLTGEGTTYTIYKIEDTWYYYPDQTPVADDIFDQLKKPGAKMIDVAIGYEGENRIWEDWQSKMDIGELAVNNTTQGEGSCFTFYANDPSEKTNILEMLRAFTVAFVDQEGNQMASAILDVDHNFESESGKITVPLVLSSGVTYTDENGIARFGITAMEQNAATWITAIIYLNGSSLSNEHVLATREIEGNLNLQFGTSVSLETMGDEVLLQDYRTVSAQAFTSDGQKSENEREVITYEYDGNAKDVKVVVSVEGKEEPKRVEASFVRSIGSGQGARSEPISFTRTGNGVWEATFQLTTPGDYILYNVSVDGIDYSLENRPKAVIEGYKISNLLCTPAGGVIMTAENGVDVDVSVDFGASSAYKPASVRALFRSPDGKKEFSAFMEEDTAITGRWAGTARIASSGTYILQYLIVDGVYRELTEEQQLTFMVYLSMYTRVWSLYDSNEDGAVTVEDYTFDFMGEREIPVQVKVWDGNDTEMRALENVHLYYHVAGSNDDDDGMYNKLGWNTNSGYYEGKFALLNAGEYSFDRLKISIMDGNVEKENTITKVTDAPVFMAVSTKEAEYMTKTAAAASLYQLKLDGTAATISAQFKDAPTATFWAEVENQNGTLYMLKGSRTATVKHGEGEDEYTLDTYTFELKANDAPLEGNFKLLNLYAQNVYIGGEYHRATTDEPTEETAYKISVESENVTTKVVTTPRMKFTDADGVEYNSTKQLTKRFEGVFMQQFPLTGLTFMVTDFEGKAINGVTGARWDIHYEPQSGYTLTAGDDIQITAAGTSSFTFGYNDFSHGGTYTSTFKILSGEDVLQASLVGPRITVVTALPQVYIKDITMDGAGAYAVDLNATGSLTDSSSYEKIDSGCLPDYKHTCTTHKDHIFAANNTQYISQIDSTNKTATLYFKCSHVDSVTYDGGTNNGSVGTAKLQGHKYSYNNGEGVPKAVLNLTNMGNATAAKLVFAKDGGGDVIMVTQYSSDSGGYYGDVSAYGTDKFEWTADGDCARFIGVMDNDSNATKSDTKTAAGKLTADTLILTYGGVEYSFKIDKITINNPS